MKTWLIVVSVLAVLLAVATGVGFWMWSDAKGELASTEAELASTEAELASTEAELTDIKEVYPLSEFGSVSELEDWVNLHEQDEGPYLDDDFRAGLKVQESAMSDGYLVSVMVDMDDDLMNGVILCGALVDGALYVWSPVGDEVFDFYSDIFER